MQRNRSTAVIGLAVAMTLCTTAFADGATRTYRWVLTDYVSRTGVGGAFNALLVGPLGGTVVNTRLRLEFVTADGWDAAGVRLNLVGPIEQPGGSVGAEFEATGADFGWSGLGNFKTVYETDALNGPIAFTLWSLALNDFFDPYFGRYLQVEIELEIGDLVADEFCAGDLNGDGEISATDLQDFQVGDCPVDEPCLADLDGDGTVTMADRELLISYLGIICPVAPNG